MKKRCLEQRRGFASEFLDSLVQGPLGMPMVGPNLHSVFEQLRYISSERRAEFHPVDLCPGWLASFPGTIGEQPEPTLAMDSGDESRFGELVDSFAHREVPLLVS